MDVTPRLADLSPEPRTATGTGRRKWLTVAVLAVLLVAVGFLLKQALGSASTYYYNVDEAVAQRDDLGDRNIRIQGTVTEASSSPGDGSTRFTLSFQGADVEVAHTGDTPALFKVGQPVVAQGHFEGDTFQSDQIAIKHSETYREENPDRVPPSAA